ADGHLHLVAQRADHLAHAELRALQRQVGEVADAHRPLGELGRLAALQREADRLRHAVERQVAGHLVAAAGRLDRGALEGDDRELLGVEEVRALQMAVAPGVVGVHARGLDGQVERRPRGVPLVKDEAAGELVEAAVDPRQAQVLDLEADRAVVGVHAVLLAGAALRQQGAGEDQRQGERGEASSHQLAPSWRGRLRTGDRDVLIVWKCRGAGNSVAPGWPGDSRLLYRRRTYWGR